MSVPVLHLLAGPNGSGKTTFYERVLRPTTHLPFINADVIAQQRWPQETSVRAYDAAREAARLRQEAIAEQRSFVTETVFSHSSKLDLVNAARNAGYRLYIYAILIPEELAVHRVRVRVETGGHDVPEDKIRGRYRRLWSFVSEATRQAHEAEILDNSRAANPFRLVARYQEGELVGEADWPPWTPAELRKS